MKYVHRLPRRDATFSFKDRSNTWEANDHSRRRRSRSRRLLPLSNRSLVPPLFPWHLRSYVIKKPLSQSRPRSPPTCRTFGKVRISRATKRYAGRIKLFVFLLQFLFPYITNLNHHFVLNYIWRRVKGCSGGKWFIRGSTHRWDMYMLPILASDSLLTNRINYRVCVYANERRIMSRLYLPILTFEVYVPQTIIPSESLMAMSTI